MRLSFLYNAKRVPVVKLFEAQHTPLAKLAALINTRREDVLAAYHCMAGEVVYHLASPAPLAAAFREALNQTSEGRKAFAQALRGHFLRNLQELQALDQMYEGASIPGVRAGLAPKVRELQLIHTLLLQEIIDDSAVDSPEWLRMFGKYLRREQL